MGNQPVTVHSVNYTARCIACRKESSYLVDVRLGKPNLFNTTSFVICWDCAVVLVEKIDKTIADELRE